MSDIGFALEVEQRRSRATANGITNLERPMSTTTDPVAALQHDSTNKGPLVLPDEAIAIRVKLAEIRDYRHDVQGKPSYQWIAITAGLLERLLHTAMKRKTLCSNMACNNDVTGYIICKHCREAAAGENHGQA